MKYSEFVKKEWTKPDIKKMFKEFGGNSHAFVIVSREISKRWSQRQSGAKGRNGRRK